MAKSRSPHGERGLKSKVVATVKDAAESRSPHGERGLKFLSGPRPMLRFASLPTRGAWIEIPGARICSGDTGRSPHGERGLKSSIVK